MGDVTVRARTVAQMVEINVIRGSADEHGPFILSSWASTYRQSPFGRQMREGIFFHFQRQVAVSLIQSSEIWIATPVDDPKLFLGWMVCDSGGSHHVLHYVFVKDRFRRLGVARKLLERINVTDLRYTHSTAEGQWLHSTRIIDEYTHKPRWKTTKWPSAVFNPFLLYSGIDPHEYLEVKDGVLFYNGTQIWPRPANAAILGGR